MASTKASRKGNGSDNGSKTIKARKAHESKAAITKSAVKKSNAKAKKTREYVMKKKDKPVAQNGRQPGRQLIRWNVCTDQILLLILEYELKRHGISVPWDAVAKRLASEKDTTGPCVQQHLTKLRKEMLARGSWVPPLSGKPGNKQPDSNIRGYVQIKKRNGENEIREILWTEDAFKYVDLVHINKTKMFETTRSLDNGEGTSGSAHQMMKLKKSATDLSDDELDPTSLPSEEEFEPSTKKSKDGRRITRSSAKFGGHFKGNSYDSEVDADADSESDSETNVIQERKPIMMALYQSDDEEERFAGLVIFSLPPYLLARYPEGINETYVHTPGIQVSNTNRRGEEIETDDTSDSASYHPANTGENYLNAFLGGNTSVSGQPYSITDVKPGMNYLDAYFDGDNSGQYQPYSMMDANNSENYANAFYGEENSGYVAQDGYGWDEDQRDNTNIGNINPNVAQPSNQLIRSGRFAKKSKKLGHARRDKDNSHSGWNLTLKRTDNQQAGQGNLMGMNVQNSASVQNASGQTSHAIDGIGYNPRQSADARDLLVGAFANRESAKENEGKTFAQIVAQQKANMYANDPPLGNGASMTNGFAMGNNTGSVNDPFVYDDASFNYQMDDVQTGTDDNLWAPAIAVNGNTIYQNDADITMNGFEFNAGNNGNVMPEPDENEPQGQEILGFEDLYGYAADSQPYGYF